MGPVRVQSLGGKKYILVVVDDFTRYTWVMLLKDKEIGRASCRERV